MARSQTGGDRDQYPLFQLWRPDGSGQYERVYESNSGTGLTVDQPGLTLQNMYHKTQCHFKLVIYWECINLVMLTETD